MPIYEYRCTACKRRNSVFVRSMASTARPRCERCGSAKMTRLMSKFAVHRAGGGGDDGLGDDFAGMDDVDENDPQSVARWARRMKSEAGEDLGPEFDEMIDRMESGELPPDEMDGDDGGGGLDEF